MDPTDSEILLPLPSAEDPDPDTGTQANDDGGATFAFADDAALPADTSVTRPTGTVPSDAFLHGGRVDPDGLPIPDVPGFRIVRRLGRGGMGEVHLADRISDTGVSLRCALKVVHPGRRADPIFAEQILSEASIVAELRHPNIVSIIDVGRIDDQIWMAMEWIDGCDARSLRRMARDRGADIPLRHVAYIAREALQGLHHAHVARSTEGRPLGIVHRDLSPGNILISRHGAVKLADFGVAAARAIGPSKLRLVGKPQYLAPELYEGQEATPRSDLFAMGVTLWELVTMEPLFPRNLSLQEAHRRIREFDPKQALSGDLTIPDGLEPILLRALAPDPYQRYATALEMLEDVSDFAYEAGLRLLDAHFGRYVQRSIEHAEQNADLAGSNAGAGA